MSFLLIVAGMALTFAIVILVHEWGHYIAARAVGVRPTHFSLGFGRVIASRTDKRGCRWQIAALPLGGYCRLKGDANAASLSGEIVGPPEPGSLAAALPARALVIAAGPAINLALAVLLFGVGAALTPAPTHPLRVVSADPRIAADLL